MIELGYMAKRIVRRPDWLQSPHVQDIFSVSACVSENFCNYVSFWRHNGFWLFDRTETIQELSNELGLRTDDLTWLYYRGYDSQFDNVHKRWEAYFAEPSFVTNAQVPATMTLLGYDVVCYSQQNAPECSPLSCNHLAETLNVNSHCLVESLDAAMDYLQQGAFDRAEPGPFRIVAVHRVDLP